MAKNWQDYARIQKERVLAQVRGQPDPTPYPMTKEKKRGLKAEAKFDKQQEKKERKAKRKALAAERRHRKQIAAKVARSRADRALHAKLDDEYRAIMKNS